MPRFYFHHYNDVEDRDSRGIELASLAAARMVAIHKARVAAAGKYSENGWSIRDDRIVIEDAAGNVLDTVYFEDSVKVE